MARSSKAKGGKPIPDRVLDRLYGAAPEEFTAGRNAAAKELRQAGDGEVAAAVRALPRPNAPAAAINRAVRAEPEQARALLDAADDLRRAHEAVVGGEADRDTLKAAVAAERQAVRALAATHDARASTLAMDVPVTARPPAQRKRRADDEAKRKAEQERQRLTDAVRAARQSVDRRSADVEQAERARERANADLREARERLKEARAELRRARRRLG